VLVNLVHDRDSALQGVLWQSRGAWLVLRNVSVIKTQAPPTPVDGDVVIHRDHVAFIQVLP
jgi:hypothetical protein